MEQLGRYLKGTITEGLILRSTHLSESDDSKHFDIDVFVDADFASGLGTELGTNPYSVKSRTVYIIKLMGCPVIWCYKFQESISTSTM